jgi:hypothetical protein
MFDQEFIRQIGEVLEGILAARLQSPKILPRYMDYAQAGDYIGVSQEAVRAYVKQGYFSIIKKGGKRWIDKEDIDAFMLKNKWTLQGRC